jgi:cyanate permease
MFSGQLIAFALLGLIFVDDSNLILLLALGLGFVWAVVMAACLHLFIQRDRERSGAQAPQPW